MQRVIALVLLIFSFSCSIDGLRDNDSGSELEGQWILEEVSCFCYFQDYDFAQNQMWIFPDQGFLVSRSNLQEPLGISPPNALARVTFQENRLIETSSGRSYEYTLENNRLVLQYVDNEAIADDEISYYFRKGTVNTDCINPKAIKTDAACVKIYDPVCGCDGITYSNTCEAENAGITSYTSGICN